MLAVLARVIHSPPIRAFVLSLACWLLAFSYCKFRFWREPHSAFFDGSDRQWEFKYSKLRAEQGLNYLHKLGPTTSASTAQKASSSPEICAAVVTIKREGTQYIDAMIGSMLQGLTEKERGNIEVKVLFADPEPSVHPTWNQPWLAEAVDWAGTYNVSVEEHARLTEMFVNHWWGEKGIM